MQGKDTRKGPFTLLRKEERQIQSAFLLYRKDLFIFYFRCMGVLPTCMCSTCVKCHRGQKRVLDPLELDPGPLETSQYPWPLGHPSSSFCISFYSHESSPIRCLWLLRKFSCLPPKALQGRLCCVQLIWGRMTIIRARRSQGFLGGGREEETGKRQQLAIPAYKSLCYCDFPTSV